ncbi:MAG: phenylalanine--tRNA ligase subunit alpha [Candidatus Lokiarchaeota archaeon]|nr:phenylalanine--tRNA ligase subunit alpha [Candidatus Lokiarchaeota archaeon]MBD3202343.1 phenylalanine--tRNA ligase subunit alpha [Candidatus Lokiarchaeota archaeon]
MTIKLEKQTIEIFKKLRKEDSDSIIASNFAKKIKTDYIVLMSAINELKKHSLGDFKEEEVFQISLTDEGISYLKKNLPERQLLNLMLENELKEIVLEDLLKRSKFNKKLFYIALSHMKSNRWIAQSKATGENKVFLIEEEFPKTEIEIFLQSFKENDKISYNELTKNEKKFVDKLNKRKLIKKQKKTKRIIYLTEKGKKTTLSQIEELSYISKLDTEMIITGSWKEYDLKPFDVSKPGPLLKAGKIHPMIRLINEIREIFLSLGFTEIRGPIIESAFFNFDALFQPQDHPARELHDTFYLDNPKVGSLPEKSRVKAVKETHENGGDSGSKGWGYEWKEDIAKQTLLRTHTTATTIRRLAQYHKNNDQTPIKVFSIDRVFRNEKVDKSHLAEFTQIEGIVIDQNVTLCDLIGLITEFYKKMGFEKVVTRPGFFPYTEPSMEVSVYYDKLGEWLEMGGSGIFRPEVTYPWGIKNPTRVLAWGLGLERLAMLKFQRKDIRDLYINPLKWLREESY